jgi:archaellum component FlaC
MFDHERYEELASLAAVGELLPEEHEEFVRHRQSCNVCGKMVAEIGSISAATFLARGQEGENSIVEGERHRRAREAVARRLPLMIPNRSVRGPMRLVAVGVAAALVVGIGIGMIVGLMHAPRVSPAAAHALASTASITTLPAANQPTATPGQLIATQSDSGRWQTVVAEQQSQVNQVRDENQKLRERLSASDETAHGLETRLDGLARQSNAQAQQLEQAHNDLSTIQSRLTQAQTLMVSNDATVNSLQSQLSEKDARLNEVTASLEREREMLAQGRDVRDIMGARDLHIVDVFDADGKGRTRKPYGRAFYTQGKSLIFYAFDLPTKNLLDGKFVYTAWGSNSNKLKDQAPHHLGIFYYDDQTQHRWALKFNNPKVLDEIDTVFVTLERLGAAFTVPKGKPVLEAYFGTPPNHP